MESLSVRFANKYLGDPNFFRRKTAPRICIPYIWSATASSIRPVFEKMKNDFSFVFQVPFPKEKFRGMPDASVVITTHYHTHLLVALKEHPAAIYYPHGLGSETYKHHDMGVFDLALLNGSLPDVPKECNYEMIGWTKSDILFDKSELNRRKEIINKKLKLDELPYDKTLLWCDNDKPNTYRVNAQIIYNWCEENKVNLLVKGKDRRTGRRYETPREPWERYINSSLEYNIYVIAQFADLLIAGEGSSVIREMYAAGVPAFNMMIPGNERLYDNQPELYHATPNKLVDCLTSGIDDKLVFMQHKNIIRKFFSHLDGKATDRFVKVIMRYLE